MNCEEHFPQDGRFNFLSAIFSSDKVNQPTIPIKIATIPETIKTLTKPILSARKPYPNPLKAGVSKKTKEKVKS